jgi:hypothetical protein
MNSGDSEPKSDDAALLSFVATRDIPCPVCGYNLRGNESIRCSECGATLQLRVGSLDLKLAPWLVALLGTALPMGAVGLIVTGMLFMMRRFADPNAARVTGALIALFILYGAVIHFLVQKRRKLWSARCSNQWRITGIVLLLNAIAFSAAILIPSLFR